MKTKHLIIGAGQIGTALFNVFKETGDDVYIRDIENDDNIGKVDFLHICFPYSEFFVDEVKIYQAIYKPEITIIHSTVPLGTNRRCNSVSSPIHGIHPNLEKGIKTFIKYIGAVKNEDAERVAELYDKIGIKYYFTINPETAEAHKFILTTLYGLSIISEKLIEKYCFQNNISFYQAYHKAIEVYNEGYKQLGKENVCQPIIEDMPGKIGGHCIIPNLEFFDSDIARFVKEQNEKIS